MTDSAASVAPAYVPDLRILALADANLLPPEVQEPFDKWRIWRAREAVVSAVRRRLHGDENAMIQFMLERLEAADDEQGIFEGIYALSEVVELHRRQLGLHSGYVILIMAGRINPYGLLEMSPDFDNPPVPTVEAAIELWRLARAAYLNVELLLHRISGDELLVALEHHRAAKAGRQYNDDTQQFMDDSLELPTDPTPRPNAP